MPHNQLNPFPLGRVELLGGVFASRFGVNRNYVMSLKNDNLLQNYHFEAGNWGPNLRCTYNGGTDSGDGMHWGWEAPTCQLRGHFTGHWISAAARLLAITGDPEVKIRLDRAVDGLAVCQDKNGGEWCGSIPEKYLHLTARGMPTWAPHYVVHKTLMGLVDAYKYGGSQKALEILVNWARWFSRWTDAFDRETMDDILDVETGGMFEAWADLYGITGEQEHLDLMHRYERRRLFEPLLEGRDALTNLHANTTVPEAHGAARAYEVTGDARWRRIVEAYWRCAVIDRGSYCTGGQTCGEIWTPPFELAARLGEKTQEHCVVYNMIRLAEYLYRWTGDVTYADYIERNLYNGILAQQHPGTGMMTYWLGLEPGARKRWGSPTNDFWCCYGTLVQAHTLYNELAWYEDEDGIVVSQYIPSRLRWERPEGLVTIEQAFEPETGCSTKKVGQGGSAHRPERWLVDLTVRSEIPVAFALKLRLPWWLAGQATVSVNDREEPASGPDGYHVIHRTWSNDTIRLSLPKGLWTSPLPDEPDTVAFMDGPTVLAGLCDEQRTLAGDKDEPDKMLAAHNEREWGSWLNTYRTLGQDANFRFLPIHEVVDQRYTVYFPVRKP